MATVASDIEIARAAKKLPIIEVGAKLGIPAGDLAPYGYDKAKIGADFIAAQAGKKDGKLILVTAINPTPAGGEDDDDGRPRRRPQPDRQEGGGLRP